MKFFIDTANPGEIKKAYEMGVMDGVTTNPSLISKENRDFASLIKEICEIIRGLPIVSSIRHPIHVLEAALIGADVATIPYKVIEQLVKHSLTEIGIERFLEDWKKVPKR